MILRRPSDVEGLVQEWGFLPFFKNRVRGLSIQEHVPPELWFSEEPGPWEWKGSVLRRGNCVYGKFFEGKAGYISLDWFYDFANYRRDGYDFDARCEDKYVPAEDIAVMEELQKYPDILSRALKKKCGYWGKEKRKGFDPVINRLQMEAYVLTSDFEYDLDKKGEPYGWGLARYATVENRLGADIGEKIYVRSPEASYERMREQLLKYFPDQERNIAILLERKN
ncbi:MAG: hypothetical protein IKE21_01630 [Erysipelotrichaceae bacterium]|nr:hypothetical protein [Erysipelotrichaceae bacterium]